MKQNITSLIRLEKNIKNARLGIEKNQQFTTATIETYSLLEELLGMVEDALGSVLPEECIFDGAPYPTPLIADENSLSYIRDSFEHVDAHLDLLEKHLKRASSHFTEKTKKLLKEIAKDLYAYSSL